MPKHEPESPDTVTLTRAELASLIRDEVAASAKMIARGAADATVEAQRGAIGQSALDPGTAAEEERVAKVTGRKIPDRIPHALQTARCRWEDAASRLAVEFTAEIAVRPGYVAPTHERQGGLLHQIHDTTEMTVTRCFDFKYPPVEELQARWGFDDAATFPPAGLGRLRKDIDPKGRNLSLPFLQQLISALELPVRRMFQGKDIRFLKQHIVDGPSDVDGGEKMRTYEGSGGGRRSGT